MKKRDLVKESKFYLGLNEIEIKIREITAIGIHLKLVDPILLKKLDDAADAIAEFFEKEGG